MAQQNMKNNMRPTVYMFRVVESIEYRIDSNLGQCNGPRADDEKTRAPEAAKSSPDIDKAGEPPWPRLIRSPSDFPCLYTEWSVR